MMMMKHFVGLRDDNAFGVVSFLFFFFRGCRNNTVETQTRSLCRGCRGRLNLLDDAWHDVLEERDGKMAVLIREARSRMAFCVRRALVALRRDGSWRAICDLFTIDLTFWCSKCGDTDHLVAVPATKVSIRYLAS